MMSTMINHSQSFWEVVKTLIVAFFLSLTSFFEPIKDFVYVLLILNVLDAVFGYRYFRKVKGEPFSKTKLFKAFKEMATYMLFICAMFIIGHYMHDHKPAIFVIKTVVYALILLYARNIAKNRHRTYPANEFWEWAYFALSMQLHKKLPFYKDYQAKKNEKNKQ